MITLQKVWTATDRGYEKIANLEYYIARRSKISGDVTIFNRGMILSMHIYVNVQALESLSINISPEQDRKIYLLIERIKTLTQQLKTWQ